jgi:hypothetical protein
MGKRSNVRAASAFVLIVASLGAAFGACTQYKSYAGQECLKDDECLAGACVAGVCVQPPPLIVGGVDAGHPASEAGGDSAAPLSDDSGDDGPAVLDTGLDSAGPVDAGEDTGSDSGHDADTTDASNDTSDAPDSADASNDVSAPPDSSDDAPVDADDDATGAREVRPDSLFA